VREQQHIARHSQHSHGTCDTAMTATASLLSPPLFKSTTTTSNPHFPTPPCSSPPGQRQQRAAAPLLKCRHRWLQISAPGPPAGPCMTCANSMQQPRQQHATSDIAMQQPCCCMLLHVAACYVRHHRTGRRPDRLRERRLSTPSNTITSIKPGLGLGGTDSGPVATSTGGSQ
jgi:hypothetical protein